MVIHTQVDWRTPEQALAWDLALVRGIFYRIGKQYGTAHHGKRNRSHADHGRSHDDAIEGNQTLEPPTTTIEESPHTADSDHDQLDEHRLIAKADVLIGLKTTENFLEKRPFLRALYTNLACCANEKEMANVASYVKYRVRERTLSYTMVATKLTEIYTKHIDLLAFEAKIDTFKAAARAKSTWCVRDPKAICKAPSRFYGVHNIPPRPKTQKQIDLENQLIHSHAVAVATTAISVVVSRLVDAAKPKSSSRQLRSAESGRRDSSSRGGSETHEKRLATRDSSSLRLTGAAKAKQKRDQQQAEARRKELRIQILMPGPKPSLNTNNPQELILAAIEANGDLAIAQQLLQQKIPRSGFARVMEHLANLGGGTGEKASNEDVPPDEWAMVKLWKTVYRSRTIQAIQQLEQ